MSARASRIDKLVETLRRTADSMERNGGYPRSVPLMREAAMELLWQKRQLRGSGGGDIRAATIEECARAVDHCNGERRYHEPTDWAYGAQDALIAAAKAVRSLSPLPDPPEG